MSSDLSEPDDLDEVPREDEPAVPPGTDGDDEREQSDG
jgi:hypothetical protein